MYVYLRTARSPTNCNFPFYVRNVTQLYVVYVVYVVYGCLWGFLFFLYFFFSLIISVEVFACNHNMCWCDIYVWCLYDGINCLYSGPVFFAHNSYAIITNKLSFINHHLSPCSRLHDCRMFQLFISITVHIEQFVTDRWIIYIVVYCTGR